MTALRAGATNREDEKKPRLLERIADATVIFELQRLAETGRFA
jgi:hypothetical protein